MKKLLFSLFISLILVSTTYAQDALAKIEYGYAEEAFQNKEFQKTITHLNKVKELLKSTNATVMYLEILASYQLLPVSDAVKGRELKIENDGIPKLDNKSKTLLTDAEAFQNINELTNKFLKSFSETAPLEKTKAIYTIQKNIASSTIGIKDIVEALKAKEANNYTQAITLLNKVCTAGNQFACEKVIPVVLENKVNNGDNKAATELLEYYNKIQDYDNLNSVALKIAEKGDDIGMDVLGLSYYVGRGVQKDYAKAKYWFEKAIEKGNVNAINNMGVLYYIGFKDYTEGKKWLEMAIEKGYIRSMYHLGSIYENEKSGYYNIEKAFYWYTEAAEKGETLAMNNLGVLYWNSKKKYRDYDKAKYWFKKACELGNELACKNYQITKKY